jgi:hypothetical protein
LHPGQWLATICFLQSAPTAFANIGYKFYIVFIISTITLWILLYRFFPETAGLSLEEMAQVFGDEVVSDLKDEYLNQLGQDKERRENQAVQGQGGNEKAVSATEIERAV